MGSIVAGMKGELHPLILDQVENTKPYLGTLWLMIPVCEKAVLESVKRLLVLKSDFVRQAKAK